MTPPTPRRIAVVGMFDGLHAGHRSLLRHLANEARTRGLKPLVISFANHPLSLIAPQKAPGLLSSPSQKFELLRGEGFLPDEILITPFDEALRSTSAAQFLDILRDRHAVDVLLMGFNNHFGHDAPRDFHTYRDLAARAGITLIQAPELQPSAPVASLSSSTIRTLIAEGDVATAAKLLGRPYSIEGRVIAGKALGRTIGFPTANILPAPATLIPAQGVYAAIASLPSGDTYPAMVNIGHRPTVDNTDAPISIEAHIIDLPQGSNLYNIQLTLAFSRRLRPERRFPTLDALRAQLAIDRAETIAAIYQKNRASSGSECPSRSDLS